MNVACPFFEAPHLLPDSRFRLTLDVDPERSYFIESSPNLLDWSVVANLPATNSLREWTEAPQPGFPERCYRAVSEH